MDEAEQQRRDAPAVAPSPHAAFDNDEFRRAVEHAKLDAMKELAYGASHEINNPLANIAARAQTMLRTERDESNRRMLTAIHRQAMRAHEMISDLMLFARPPRMHKEPLDLVGLLSRVVEEVRPLAEERGILVEQTDPDTEVDAVADPVQLEVAVAALLTNSIEALDAGGEVAAAARRIDDLWVIVEVSDNGPGVPPAVREHMFDPFYSGREAGRGLGFGLSKCWRIITEHGGRIDVDSGPGRGARFTLWLPSNSTDQ
ncbi:sensor histidine kinase [Posidoniimonas polymericola]|uniref:sensor histidine kinase n=1 Tax=Posidoniimonas polymericola TaxID=2528002 RepID=UPI0018D41A28|nr:HAMP domain-containing sensor histidine kinase [Posidoniimonas polymericola]